MTHIRRAAWRIAPVVAISAALALAGCSTGGVAASGGTSGGAQDLAQFQKVVDKATKPWTKWEGPDSTPAPPKDVKLALVACAGTIAGCVEPLKGAQAAAKDLGWTSTMYDGQGDPVAQNKVVTQAINSGATAILLGGIDPSQIGSALELAKSKNIPVGDITQGIAPGNGIAFDVGGDYVQSGVIMGSWIAADSKGSAVVLPTNDKEFASTVAIVDSAIDTVKKCSGCKLEPTQFFTGSQIGNGLGQQVASALQRQPNVNYVIGAFDPAVADMVPAINNVGIGSRVKIVSNVGLTQNLQFIKDGNVQAADVVYDNTYEGYAAVDQLIRVLNGKPLYKTPGATDERYAYNENVPQHLVTKDNVGDPSKLWTADNGAVDHYRKLWGIG
jgi:ABC-type sugar transport system substrate-binding protein